VCVLSASVWFWRPGAMQSTQLLGPFEDRGEQRRHREPLCPPVGRPPLFLLSGQRANATIAAEIVSGLPPLVQRRLRTIQCCPMPSPVSAQEHQGVRCTLCTAARVFRGEDPGSRLRAPSFFRVAWCHYADLHVQRVVQAGVQLDYPWGTAAIVESLCAPEKDRGQLALWVPRGGGAGGGAIRN